MKQLFHIIMATLFFLFPLAGNADDLSDESSEYDVLVNGVVVGKSVISSKKKDGHYLHVSDMIMTVGQVSTSTLQKVTETIAFTPVKIEITVITIYGANKTTMNTEATFKGSAVTLISGGKSETFTIKEPFVLDGNYFYSELIKKKMADKAEVSAFLYHPSIEAREPFRVTVKVVGKEIIPIRGKQKNLTHLAFYMETIKQADYYINDEGIAERIVQQFMNNTVELLLK